MRRKILKEIEKIPNSNSEYFKQLLQNDTLNYCKVITIEVGTRFVTSKEDVNKIWILLLGKVRALEEYTSGDIYIFQRFVAPEVFGEMEALAEIPHFRASLIAETKCVFITLPVILYLNFLKDNSEFLYKRTQSTLKRVLDEERDNRIYLMLKGIDRVKMYFIQHYEISEVEGICILRITRQHIADETGYSLKTINRVLKSLKEQKFLDTVGQKILITENQYIKMIESIEEIKKC
ncbi:Crp/Fnr family transcriptional regulator [Clostridium sp.]|uniref:Crp/Fnr family transcriptional regulator n=1 Tax=Clostridium sp. TaxID=1506 RepID=UPI00261A177B|nr:Crp/Fnr family transcriptional regulator [Clostridium sp.]